MRDEAADPSYFIAQFQDIGSRKTAQLLAVQAQQAALSAAAAKSRFLATMSHELRTPMNGIIGTLELLSLSELTSEQTEYVTVVHESSGSLLRVLNDILDFSKIDAGKLALVTARFKVRREIASIASLFASSAKKRNVRLVTRVEADVPAVLEGDAGRVRQLLINLIGNALKFTPARGSVELSGKAERHATTVTPIRFTVTDSGAGIAPEARSRLFVPFSQIDDSTTSSHDGTGLGLAICKLLVDLMVAKSA